ncbi:MAG: ABC-2 family transporter protein [Candidatus Falkowbacteria bacterium]
MKLLAIKRFFRKIKRIMIILGIAMRSRLMYRLTHRFSFFLTVVGIFLQMAITVVFFKAIYGFTVQISGWQYHEALIVVASYMIIEGFMWATVGYLNGVSEAIFEGKLDQFLVKPIDAQFLASVNRADPEDWARVVTALYLLFQVVPMLHLTLLQAFINGALYLVLLFAGFSIIYSFALIIRSIGFWTTDAFGIWALIDNTLTAARFPTDIFSNKAVRIFFSTIVPLTFLATVPAKVLIHGLNFQLIISAILVALVFFLLSRKFWLFGLSRYTSSSS